MAGEFGSAAGLISNLFSAGVGSTPIDPAFGMAKAIEQRQRDEALFAQYGLFSPIGVLKNVLGYGEGNKDLDQKINKWRKWSVENIEQMPVATAYTLFGSLYPHLLDYVQQNSLNKLNLLARLGDIGGGEEDKENIRNFLADWQKIMEKINKFLEGDPEKKIGNFMKAKSSLKYDSQTMKDVEAVNNAFWVAYDKYQDLYRKGYDKNKDEIDKLNSMLNTLGDYVLNKAYNFYLNDKRVPEYSDLLNQAASMKYMLNFVNRYPQEGVFTKKWYDKKNNISFERTEKVIEAKRDAILKAQAEAATKETPINYWALADQYLLGGALQNIVNAVGDSELGKAMGDIFVNLLAEKGIYKNNPNVDKTNNNNINNIDNINNNNVFNWSNWGDENKWQK